MRLLLFAIFLIISIAIFAQVKVEATPTGKHARAINKAKESREEIKARKEAVKERKKQYREAKKEVKQYQKARKEYRKKYDSLVASNRSRLRLDSLSVPGLPSYRHKSLDSIRWITKEDSLEISRRVLDESRLSEKHRRLILEPPVPIDKNSIKSMDSLYSKGQGLDSMAIEKGESIATQMASAYLPDELNAPEDPLGNFQDPLAGKSKTIISRSSRPNPNLVSPEKAKELFKKIDPDQFKEVQSDMEKLKKKYSKLPDSRYPEEGTKRNSLQDVPFAKRLYFGGNVSLTSTDPLIVSSNLQLGYWINKKWLGGVGLTLREQFTSEDTTSLVSGDGYGFSFFTRYELKKGFFAWAEGESQVNRSFFGVEVATTKEEWQWAYLVGIGREFSLGKVNVMSLILYDLNYQNNTLNARPFVFKMGVRFSKKPE